ncbi:MAG: TolC family protein [Pirellulaceae bacterium]
MRRLRFATLIVLATLAGCQSLAEPRAGDAKSPVSQASYFDPAPEPPSLLAAPPDVEELPEAESKSLEPKQGNQLTLPLGAGESLSLRDAAAITLGQNPDLIATRQAEGVSQGALGVAETYPFNPWVQVQVAPSPQRRDGSTGTTAHYILLIQTLQLAHQRQHREAAAQSVLNGTRWNIVQAELQAVAQTERLYFMALYRQGLRDVLRENAALSREVLTISEKQLAAGALSKSDVAIARLDEAASRQRAELGEANYQTALLDLRRQLNLPMEHSLELRGSLADLQFSPTTSAAASTQIGNENLPVGMPQIAEQLAANRPDVLAAHSDFDASRANLNLAHANRVPDLQVGPFYQQTDNGTVHWGIRAQSDLPVLNTGMPLVRQRAAEVNQRQSVWQQLQARASLEAQAAIDRYERARRIAADAGISGKELPEELTKLEAQFKAGEIDLLRIVTARTSLLAARQAHLDILSELAQSAAALTAATGLPPEVIVGVR